MKNNYTIHIPTPCHENWDVMTPVQQGRFCQSCAKQVVDFSLMTDQEVLNYFSKSTGNTCGRFNTDQLQRPLQPIKIEKKRTWWVLAMMPLLLFFSKALAQKKQANKNIIKINQSVMGLGEVVITKVSNPTDYWPVQSDDDERPAQTPVEKCKPQPVKLTVERRKGDDNFMVSGTLIDNQVGEPLPYATVTIKGTKTAVFANDAGSFSIKGRTTGNQAVISINAVGFESTDILVQIKDTVDNISRTITGKVVDAGNNQPVAYASIIVAHTGIATTTGEDGTFSLAVDNKVKNPSISVTNVGYYTVKLPVIMGADSIINLDTIKLINSVSLDDVVVVAGKVACSYDKPKKTDTIPTFIRKVFNTNAFKVYPNPAQSGSHVTVDVKNEGSYSIQLYSNNGNLIMASPVEATKGAVQTNIAIPLGLTPGMYYIRLFDNKKKKQYTDKLTIM